MMIGLSDPLWDLIQNCWDGDRSQRPWMQDVEVRVGNAAAQWETPVPPRPIVPLSYRPRESSQSLAMVSPSSTETRNSSASDLPRWNIPEIRIDVVGPEENDPHLMQEFYPTPSPISPNPGTQSSETLINRLDGVSPRIIWYGLALTLGLVSRTRFSRWTGTNKNAEQVM